MEDQCSRHPNGGHDLTRARGHLRVLAFRLSHLCPIGRWQILPSMPILLSPERI
jgi:hypothetical protein